MKRIRIYRKIGANLLFFGIFSTIEAMELIAINAVLVFALTVPIVMTYRILPVEGTPYWLFALYFFLAVAGVAVSMSFRMPTFLSKHKSRLRVLILCFVLAISLGGSSVTAMFDRARVAPVWGVHDIVLQEEAAMRYLIVGKNPYKETYFGTPVESFRYAEVDDEHAVNPALYHFVMPPWYLLFPFIFYYPSVHFLHFFDARMALIGSMILLLWGVYRWIKSDHLKMTALTLTAVSPAVVSYFIEGRSDVFALSWVVLSLMFLSEKKLILSATMFALAVMSKQTIWLMVPFFAVYVWAKYKKHKQFTPAVVSFILTCVALVVPFLIWDARAFFDSVVLYLLGNTAHSYPVSGYGLGMVLYEFGSIKNLHAYYPFVLWQIALAGPVLWYTIVVLARTPRQSTMLFSYGTFLFVYWWASRYFNNSHVSYLSMVFVLAVCTYLDEGAVEKRPQ